MKLQSNIWLATTALAAATLVWCTNETLAADKAAIDPTGRWKVSTSNSQTNSKSGAENTLVLKLEGGKLTGTITHQSNINGEVRIFESPIKDSKLQGDGISFSVTHAPHVGQASDITSRYTGKITGDLIKGKVESEWSGQTFSKNWEARRVKQ